MDIHERILALCKARHWSLYKLAHEAGIPEGTVYGWFNEVHSTPSADSIEDVCAAFGISLSTFYNDPDLDKLTPEQAELLELFDRIPPTKRPLLLQIVRAFTESFTY